MDLRPEVSIVIPTLNEEESLKGVLSSMASQKDVAMEIIVSDGGSSDNTLETARSSGLRIRIVCWKAGRAGQLNAGAAASNGEYLLFLHADSLFNDRMALRSSVDALRTAAREKQGRAHAGHFALRFRREPKNPSSCKKHLKHRATEQLSKNKEDFMLKPEKFPHPFGYIGYCCKCLISQLLSCSVFHELPFLGSFGYRYLESKARLNRKGCSHGDQGILLPADLFRRYGGFDEGCQILAETRFADRLRENGRWMLLPAEISSSARRFEKEGMRVRQTLNAVIMALGAAGQEELIEMTGLYLPNEKSGKLQLHPVFRKIEQEISSLERKERTDFWEKVGGYICENAWQVPFALDVLLTCRAEDPESGRNYPLLGIHDRHLKRLIGNRMSVRLAACAGRLWARYMVWR